MMQILEKFDERTALGILARTALALEDEGNPDAKLRVDGEELIRLSVLSEARKHLNIPKNDESPETIGKIGDFLDEESDRLAGVIDTTSALSRLATQGDLPSDLYKIDIIPSVADLHGNNFGLEKQLIEATIRSPHREQHFGPESKAQEPYLISLFARQFKTIFPHKDFTMLVLARRSGDLTLQVHQAWRIYPSLVKTGNVKDLVDLLHRFSDSYGYDVELGGEKGHFFITLDQPGPLEIIASNASGKSHKMIGSYVIQADARTGHRFFSFVVVIDAYKYRAVLNQMNLKPSDLVDSPKFLP